MITPPSFPVLAGQGWSVHKRPTFSTRVASHVSGREVRRSLYAGTLYEYEVTFDGLASNAVVGSLAGLGASSLQTLLGFYLTCQGQFGTFLYTDPSDNAVKGQAIATGDGATTNFTMVRSIGGFTEPVSWVTAISNVYVGGAALSASTITQPNIVTLPSAPAAGAAITADFTFAFVCRFLDDQEDFENIMLGLWQMQSLKFRSVRTS